MMRRYSLSAAVFALVLSAVAARADEFKLKDGSTVNGTVVAYEGNSFKVKTSYGYALVEKDKIVSIQIGSAAGSSPEKKADKTETKPTTEKPTIRATKPAEGRAVSSGQARADAAIAARAKPAIAVPTRSSVPATSDGMAPASSAAQSSSAGTPEPPRSAAAPDAQPAAIATTPAGTPPEPQPIREKISGNTYINDTYEFEMYKPPDWQVMDGARSALPGAVAAMGTDDQSTYLVVGQQPIGKSAAADNTAMEQRLNEILVNYRPIGDEHLTVSGEPVVARRFRGSVDEHDWSGFMVSMPRGAKLYTIFGMTRADDDLVQIQENVIRRTIASFQFLPQ